jgi:sulfur carrier protein
MNSKRAQGDSAEIVVNGDPKPLAGAETVAALLERLAVPATGRGVAVAIEGEVVPRSQWSERRLAAGDRVEVVRAVQGG